jgi:D-aminoacyl-tRNA deacylase
VRAVVQVVDEASVTVEGAVVASVGAGLLLLVGVTHGDDDASAVRLAAKVWDLRVLDDERSASDVDAPVLVVSQFTLYADTSKGRRPSWSRAAPADVAEPLVDKVCQELERRGATVARGVFGAHMAFALVNDGPRTLVLDV